MGGWKAGQDCKEDVGWFHTCRIYEHNGRSINRYLRMINYIASLSSDKMNAVQSLLSLMARYASAMSMSWHKSFITLMHLLHVQLPSASTVSISAAWRTWSEESFSDTKTDVATVWMFSATSKRAWGPEQWPLQGQGVSMSDEREGAWVHFWVVWEGAGGELGVICESLF